MSTRVFVARLVGLTVFDPLGDRVGRVRDVVVDPDRLAAHAAPPERVAWWRERVRATHAASG